jgi:hypothetical protein
MRHLSPREYGQESHENDDEKQTHEWYRERNVGRLDVSVPIARLDESGSREKEKHERNRHNRADFYNRCGWSNRQRVHRGDRYGGE